MVLLLDKYFKDLKIPVRKLCLLVLLQRQWFTGYTVPRNNAQDEADCLDEAKVEIKR